VLRILVSAFILGVFFGASVITLQSGRRKFSSFCWSFSCAAVILIAFGLDCLPAILILLRVSTYGGDSFAVLMLRFGSGGCCCFWYRHCSYSYVFLLVFYVYVADASIYLSVKASLAHLQV
jgi:hypothetical protein